jgi:ribosomal protein L11 methyltransferase
VSARRFLLRLGGASSEDLEDLVVAALWEAGTLGVESLPGRLIAYFPPDTSPAVIEGALDGAGLGEARPVVEGFEEQGDEDWMAAYREHARPFAVGARFLLDPREPDDPYNPIPDAGDRWWLRLPARRAFGTGSHETTRLVLEMLEEHPPAGKTVLDVGTGTGVLAFAARLLGATRAVGFDVDPVAVAQARANHPLNLHLGDVSVQLFTGTAAALAPGAVFDLVLVNVLPERIAHDLPALLSHVAPGGGLVLSGLLVEQREEAEQTLASLQLGSGGKRVRSSPEATDKWLPLSQDTHFMGDTKRVAPGGRLVVKDRKTAGEWLALYCEREAG